MDVFFEEIEQFIRLSAESRQALSSILEQHEWPKGQVLVKPNTVCQRIYFIEKGLSRTFYFKDGKDVTDWFSSERCFAGSMISFLTQKPDRRGVELLEPSVLCSFSYADIENLYRNYHEIEQLGRLLTNQAYILTQQRFDDLHFATAQERYNKLLLENPTIIQRAPLKMVASYLGITQETLSRIRAQY